MSQFQPLNARHGSKPYLLASYELPGVHGDSLFHGVPSDRACEILDRFLIADGLGGGSAEGSVACKQRGDFIDKPLAEHPIDALCNPMVQDRSFPTENKRMALGRYDEAFELSLPVAKRFSGQFSDLQGPNHASLIAREYAMGRKRVDLLEPLEEGLDSHRLNLLVDGFAKIPIGRWALEETADQGFQIQRRSADQKYVLPTTLNLCDLGVGFLEKLRDAVIVCRIDDIDQVMGDLSAGFDARLGRPDVHAFVNGHRIDRHDFGFQGFSKLEGDLGFARTGRSSQVHDVVQRGNNPIGEHWGFGVHRQIDRESEKAAARFPDVIGTWQPLGIDK